MEGPGGCLLGRSVWGVRGLPGVASPKIYDQGASLMWTPWGWTVHLIPKFLRALNASWGNFVHGEWLLTLQNQRCLPMPSTQPGEPHIQPPAPARSCPISEGAQTPLGTSRDLCKPQIFLWGASSFALSVSIPKARRGAELCAIWAGARAPHPCPL